MKKDDVTPEQWERRKAYMRRYKAEHRERFSQQQRDSQRRRLADPERRAAYNALQATYRREQRPYKIRFIGAFSAELAARLLEVQQGACAICRRKLDGSSKDLKPHRDHDHESGKARGMLCFNCNVIEGVLRHIGLTPLDFGQRLHDYLVNPPADSFR